MNEANDTRLYVSLNLDPDNGWQPPLAATGQWGQFLLTGPHIHAVETDWSCINEPSSVTHGAFHDASYARKYAASCGVGTRAKVIEVPPYYYSIRWGRVSPEDARPLCKLNEKRWSIEPHSKGGR